MQLAVENHFKKFNLSKSKSKNMLMSVDGFKNMVEHYCKYPIEENEVKIIKDYFVNNYRSEITRKEFHEMIT